MCPGGKQGCDTCNSWLMNEDSASLCSHKTIRDAQNNHFIKQLPGQDVPYHAKNYDPNGDEVFNKRKISNISDQSSAPPQTLFLRESCPVVITKNCDFENGVVNGAKAHVVKCFDTIVKIRLERTGREVFVRKVRSWVKVNGIEYIRTQIPLIPAFAITVHRAQGMTLKYLRYDFGGILLSYSAVTLGIAISGNCVYSTRRYFLDEMSSVSLIEASFLSDRYVYALVVEGEGYLGE